MKRKFSRATRAILAAALLFGAQLAGHSYVAFADDGDAPVVQAAAVKSTEIDEAGVSAIVGEPGAVDEPGAIVDEPSNIVNGPGATMTEETTEPAAVVPAPAPEGADPEVTTPEYSAESNKDLNDSPIGPISPAAPDLVMRDSGIIAFASGPTFTITRSMTGRTTAVPGVLGVCSDQDNTSGLLVPDYPAHLLVNVPAGQYLVLHFSLPTSWDGATQYSPYYPAVVTEVSLGYPAGSNPGVTNTSQAPVFAASWTNTTTLVSLTADILVLPQGANVPSAFSGLPIVNVLPGTNALLDLNVGLLNAGSALNTLGVFRGTNLSITGNLYSGSTVQNTTTSSTPVPMFGQVWRTSPYENYGVAYFNNQQCSAFPLPPEPPDAGMPQPTVAATLTKSFSPAVIQPGGVSTLTFTIDNGGANSGPWSFTDNLPTVYLKDNSNAPVILRIASTPNWTTSAGCSLTSSTAYPGNTTITAAGSIASGQTTCVISVQVTADASNALNYSNNNNLGYFLPSNANFAFPIDLGNTIYADQAPNSGLTGTTTSSLRVEVPHMKVDVSPATLTGTDAGNVTATWTVTVLNASNMNDAGQFNWSSQLTATNVVVTSNLIGGLTNLQWSVPAGTGASNLNGTWSIPAVLPGQFFQAQVSATVTDIDSLLSLNTIGDTLMFTPNQTFGNQVEISVGNITRPSVSTAANEQPNDSTRNQSATDWATTQSFAAPADLYRVASVEADSDWWDQEITAMPNASVHLVITSAANLITGPGWQTFTFTVLNTGSDPLANVQVTDPLLGGVVCTIGELDAGASDSSCVVTYEVTGEALKLRTNPQGPDQTEGIWWVDGDSQAYLHLAGSVTASPAYHNPATSSAPNGNFWALPAPAGQTYVVKGVAGLAVAIATPGDWGGWLTLPFTGWNGDKSGNGLDYGIFALELALLALAGLAVFATDKSPLARLRQAGAAGLQTLRQR